MSFHRRAIVAYFSYVDILDNYKYFGKAEKCHPKIIFDILIFVGGSSEVQRLIDAVNKAGRSDRKVDEVKEDSGIVAAMLQQHLKYNDQAMAKEVGILIEDWLAYKAGLLEGNDFLETAGKLMTYAKKRQITP